MIYDIESRTEVEAYHCYVVSIINKSRNLILKIKHRSLCSVILFKTMLSDSSEADSIRCFKLVDTKENPFLEYLPNRADVRDGPIVGNI